MISTKHPDPLPDDLIYTAISSKIISPNGPYNISIFVEKNKEPTAPSLLLFTAIINSKEEKWTSEEIWLKPGQHSVLQVNVGQLQKLKYQLTLRVKTEGGKNNEGRRKEWEDVRTIFQTKKERSLLVHSDKPIYKPEETVKFRVVVLNRELKPFEDEQKIRVRIIDPEGNIIKIWEEQQAKVIDGLFKAELELSSEPVLGDWRLEVTGKRVENKMIQIEKDEQELAKQIVPDEGEKDSEEDSESEEEEEDCPEIIENLIFSVEKYVLPKFKVTLKPPPFLTFEQVVVPVEVKAEYTYGKGVTGEYTVTPKRDYYGPEGKKPKITSVTGTLPENGSGVTIVDVDIKGLFQPEEMVYDGYIKFEVVVKEEQTGKELKDEVTVQVYVYPYKIETITQSSMVKPGLPFIVGFKITTQDNIPIDDPSPDALKIVHGFSYHKETSKIQSHIPNGLIFLTFETPTNELNRPERIEVIYKKLTHVFYVPQNHNRNIKDYIDLQILSENYQKDGQPPKVITNSDFQVSVKTTREFNSLNYIVQGQMEVLTSGQLDWETGQKNVNFKLNCPFKAQPEATLIVYVILEGSNEIIADSMKFFASSSTSTSQVKSQNDKEPLNNFLSIRLSEESREPGQEVTLKMKTQKGKSLIALRGVDQSILLLDKPDNDINQDSIEKLIRERNNEANQIRRVWGGGPAFQLFEQVGLLILSNARIELEQWVRPYRTCGTRNMMARGGVRMMKKMAAPEAQGLMAADMNRVAAFGQIQGGGQREIRIRSQFPETWLWEEINLEDGIDGIVNLTKKVPDTLTSWVITGYSLNPQYGLGVLPDPLKLTVFRPFFLTLNLPYSVVKGEVLNLQVLVHNYTQSNNVTTATITLDNSLSQFQFSDEPLQRSMDTRTITCQPNSVTTVTFTIIPQEFGSIMLNLKGVTDLAGDGVSQPLRVKPPGEEQRRSLSSLITLTGDGTSKTSSNVQLEANFPQDRVNGADKIKLTIISDILGSSIANLDKLLKLPVGCGEQNMLNFVADIIILNYLEASQSLSLKIKSKAIRFLEKGYQRQLTYRHHNGSYSAFGTSDSHGSTWLTAFVARSFILAKSYIHIDDQVIERALTFLSSQQDKDSGCFEESGKVIHSDMQGGSGSNGLALTAYTLLTFIEARARLVKSKDCTDEMKTMKIDEYSIVIDRAVKYIVNKSKLIDRVHDYYALILTTYALHMANHVDKDQFFDLVQNLAEHENGLTHWDNKKIEDKKKIEICDQSRRRHYPWEFRTKSVAVEMTGYALLTFILRGQVAQSTPIIRWLLKQRNANGGFVSTQDTVVGLTALGKFAELTKETETDLIVKAMPKNAEGSIEGTNKEVKLNKSNSDVLQEFILSSMTRSVDLEASGQGTALAQLSWSYFVEDQVENPGFSISVKTQNKENGLLLEISTACLLEEESNMVIVEVNLPSGYIVDNEFLVDHLKEENVKSYKRHETQNVDTKLQIYLESLNKTQVTIQVLAIRQFNIGKVAKACVSVYDYYEPMRKAREFYEPPNSTEEDK